MCGAYENETRTTDKKEKKWLIEFGTRVGGRLE